MLGVVLLRISAFVVGRESGGDPYDRFGALLRPLHQLQDDVVFSFSR